MRDELYITRGFSKIIKDKIGPRPKDKDKLVEWRKKYQHEYYLLHRDKALEYQRWYNVNVKKKISHGWGNSKPGPKPKKPIVREAVQSSYNKSDLMWMTPEKMEKVVNKITSRQVVLV